VEPGGDGAARSSEKQACGESGASRPGQYRDPTIWCCLAKNSAGVEIPDGSRQPANGGGRDHQSHWHLKGRSTGAGPEAGETNHRVIGCEKVGRSMVMAFTNAGCF
jgi:hypothetical protein